MVHLLEDCAYSFPYEMIITDCHHMVWDVTVRIQHCKSIKEIISMSILYTTYTKIVRWGWQIKIKAVAIHVKSLLGLRFCSQISVLGLAEQASAGFNRQNLPIKYILCIGNHLWIKMPTKSTLSNAKMYL